MKKENVFLVIWRSVYPLLIHFAVSLVLGFAYIFLKIFIIAFKAGGEMNAVSASEQALNSYIQHTLHILVVTSLLCIPVFVLLFHHDQKKIQNREPAERSLAAWVLLAITAVTVCISLNALIGFTGLDKFSAKYQQVSEALFSGGILLELAAVGVLGPICEEMIFRGLMFRRLCGHIKPLAAAVISSLVFGIYHGNIVQGVYAFCLGMVMALCYIRFGTVWAPILVHVAANVTSVFITEIPFISNAWEQTSVLIVGTITTTIVWILGMWFLLKKKFREKLE